MLDPCRTVWRFWQTRGRFGETRQRLMELLARAPARTAARANALWVCGYLALLQGDFPAARSLLEEGLAVAREARYPFGITMASFAVETQMDTIAELVGLDPWTIRFRNAYRNGDVKPHRKVVEDATLIETMQAAAELVGHELPADLRAMSSAPRDAEAAARAAASHGPEGR